MLSRLEGLPWSVVIVVALLTFVAVLAIALYIHGLFRKRERDYFVGTWGAERKGGPFHIVLFPGGAAERRAPNGLTEATGDWEYAFGEARIRWKNGGGVILRCTPGGVLRLPFYNGLPDFQPSEEVSLAVRRG